MQKSTALVLIALLAASLSCTPKQPSDQTASKPVESATPVTDRGTSEDLNPQLEEKWEAFYRSKYDTGDTLVVGTIGDAESLNDLTHVTSSAADIISLLFLQLTRTNPDFSHGPALARSWQFSPDHLELTFKLRDDVTWHDGVKTTAQDVKFTFEKQTDEVIAWSAIKWKENIKECVVVDDTTVKFIFKKVYPYQLMDAVVGVILPKHLLEKVPSAEWKSCEFNRNPIGNGPFKFKEWRAKEAIEVVASEKFYRGRPPLNRIIFKVVPDQENLVLQLKTGQIDFMEQVPPKFFEELSHNRDLVPYVFPSRTYVYIAWNLKNSLFQSKKVRQALTTAMDRQEIIDARLYKFAEICKGPISPIIWAYNPNLPDFPYDPEKARKWLAEEGWKDSDGDGILDKDGKRFEFTIQTNQGNKIREDITVIVQNQLKKVGISAKPLILEANTFFSNLNKKEFESAVAGWFVGLKMEMTTIWHSRSLNDKFNHVYYSNPEFDAVNDQACDEMDREKARKLWWRAQEIIVEDQPYTFLYVPKQINFLHRRFKNVQMETIGWSYNIEQWWAPKDQQKYR
ncbi:MAG: hypothetical protein HY717_17170 [Planctomycetes bacterium]|nr:hypothetical protein [Planctomycetota bacterium]